MKKHNHTRGGSNAGTTTSSAVSDHRMLPTPPRTPALPSPPAAIDRTTSGDVIMQPANAAVAVVGSASGASGSAHAASATAGVSCLPPPTAQSVRSSGASDGTNNRSNGVSTNLNSQNPSPNTSSKPGALISPSTFSLLTRAPRLSRLLPSFQYRHHCLDYFYLTHLRDHCIREAESHGMTQDVKECLALLIVMQGGKYSNATTSHIRSSTESSSDVPSSAASQASTSSSTASSLSLTSMPSIPVLTPTLLSSSACISFRSSFNQSLQNIQSFFFQLRGDIRQRLGVMEKHIKLHLLRKQQSKAREATAAANQVDLKAVSSSPTVKSSNKHTPIHLTPPTPTQGLKDRRKNKKSDGSNATNGAVISSKKINKRTARLQQEFEPHYHNSSVSRLRGGGEVSPNSPVISPSPASGPVNSVSPPTPKSSASSTSSSPSTASMKKHNLSSPDHPMWPDFLRLCHDLQVCAQFLSINYACMWQILAPTPVSISSTQQTMSDLTPQQQQRQQRKQQISALSSLSSETRSLHEILLHDLDDPLNLGDMYQELLGEVQVCVQLAILAMDPLNFDQSKVVTKESASPAVSPHPTSRGIVMMTDAPDLLVSSSPALNSAYVQSSRASSSRSGSGSPDDRDRTAAGQRGSSDGNSSGLTTTSNSMNDTPSASPPVNSINNGHKSISPSEQPRLPLSSSTDKMDYEVANNATTSHLPDSPVACDICDASTVCRISLSGCSHSFCLVCLLTHPSFGISCPSCTNPTDRATIFKSMHVELDSILFEQGRSKWIEATPNEAEGYTATVPYLLSTTNSNSSGPSPTQDSRSSATAPTSANSNGSSLSGSDSGSFSNSDTRPGSNSRGNSGDTTESNPSSSSGRSSSSRSSFDRDSPEPFIASLDSVRALLSSLTIHAQVNDLHSNELLNQRADSTDSRRGSLDQRVNIEGRERQAHSHSSSVRSSSARVKGVVTSSSMQDDEDAAQLDDTAADDADDDNGGFIAGVSCHQCKVSKHPKFLMFCHGTATSKRSKSASSRKQSSHRCNKKYCTTCLKRLYNEEVSTPTVATLTWRCPSCRGKCLCASCCRKEGRKTISAEAKEHARTQAHAQMVANVGAGMTREKSGSVIKKHKLARGISGSSTPHQQQQQQSSSGNNSPRLPGTKNGVSVMAARVSTESESAPAITRVLQPTTGSQHTAVAGSITSQPIIPTPSTHPAISVTAASPLTESSYSYEAMRSHNHSTRGVTNTRGAGGVGSKMTSQFDSAGGSNSPSQQQQQHSLNYFLQPTRTAPYDLSASSTMESRGRDVFRGEREREAEVQRVHQYLLARGMVGLSQGSGALPAMPSGNVSNTTLSDEPLHLSPQYAASLPVHRPLNHVPYISNTSASVSHTFASPLTSSRTLPQFNLTPDAHDLSNYRQPIDMPHHHQQDASSRSGSNSGSRPNSGGSNDNSSGHTSSNGDHSIRSMVEQDDRRVQMQRELERAKAKSSPPSSSGKLTSPPMSKKQHTSSHHNELEASMSLRADDDLERDSPPSDRSDEHHRPLSDDGLSSSYLPAASSETVRMRDEAQARAAARANERALATAERHAQHAARMNTAAFERQLEQRVPALRVETIQPASEADVNWSAVQRLLAGAPVSSLTNLNNHDTVTSVDAFGYNRHQPHQHQHSHHNSFDQHHPPSPSNFHHSMSWSNEQSRNSASDNTSGRRDGSGGSGSGSGSGSGGSNDGDHEAQRQQRRDGNSSNPVRSGRSTSDDQPQGGRNSGDGSDGSDPNVVRSDSEGRSRSRDVDHNDAPNDRMSPCPSESNSNERTSNNSQSDDSRDRSPPQLRDQEQQHHQHHQLSSGDIFATHDLSHRQTSDPLNQRQTSDPLLQDIPRATQMVSTLAGSEPLFNTNSSTSIFHHNSHPSFTHASVHPLNMNLNNFRDWDALASPLLGGFHGPLGSTGTTPTSAQDHVFPSLFNSSPPVTTAFCSPFSPIATNNAAATAAAAASHNSNAESCIGVMSSNGVPMTTLAGGLFGDRKTSANSTASQIVPLSFLNPMPLPSSVDRSRDNSHGDGWNRPGSLRGSVINTPRGSDSDVEMACTPIFSSATALQSYTFPASLSTSAVGASYTATQALTSSTSTGLGVMNGVPISQYQPSSSAAAPPYPFPSTAAVLTTSFDAIQNREEPSFVSIKKHSMLHHQPPLTRT